jgi:hypothetical protein
VTKRRITRDTKEGRQDSAINREDGREDRIEEDDQREPSQSEEPDQRSTPRSPTSETAWTEIMPRHQATPAKKQTSNNTNQATHSKPEALKRTVPIEAYSHRDTREKSPTHAPTQPVHNMNNDEKDP